MKGLTMEIWRPSLRVGSDGPERGVGCGQGLAEEPGGLAVAGGGEAEIARSLVVAQTTGSNGSSAGSEAVVGLPRAKSTAPP